MSYIFNNLGRIDYDETDNTQRTLQNSRYSDYITSNYFSSSLSDSHIKFATSNPSIMVTGINGGSGVGGDLIEMDSTLLYKTEQERSLDKLILMQRPFLTVPYLGKGSCDPSIESQLQQGEFMGDKKSVTTIMEKSFMEYTVYPTDQMKDRAANTQYTIEESALDGWIRGGQSTRELSN